jgi:adenine deaminase
MPVGTRARAVGVESHSLTTRRREVTIGDPDADVSFAAVVERHKATGRVGRGLATGFTLKRGAIASTVAHDAHNIVVIGARAPTWPVPWRSWSPSGAARLRCSTAR